MRDVFLADRNNAGQSKPGKFGGTRLVDRTRTIKLGERRPEVVFGPDGRLRRRDAAQMHDRTARPPQDDCESREQELAHQRVGEELEHLGGFECPDESSTNLEERVELVDLSIEPRGKRLQLSIDARVLDGRRGDACE